LSRKSLRFTRKLAKHSVSGAIRRRNKKKRKSSKNNTAF
jgi:hypothetical protein